MESFFSGVQEWVSVDDTLVKRALLLAARHDLGAMDALHIAAASTGRVDEFVTLEKSNKPICRTTEIKVVSLHTTDEG